MESPNLQSPMRLSTTLVHRPGRGRFQCSRHPNPAQGYTTDPTDSEVTLTLVLFDTFITLMI